MGTSPGTVRTTLIVAAFCAAFFAPIAAFAGQRSLSERTSCVDLENDGLCNGVDPDLKSFIIHNQQQRAVSIDLTGRFDLPSNAGIIIGSQIIVEGDYSSFTIIAYGDVRVGGRIRMTAISNGGESNLSVYSLDGGFYLGRKTILIPRQALFVYARNRIELGESSRVNAGRRDVLLQLDSPEGEVVVGPKARIYGANITVLARQYDPITGEYSGGSVRFQEYARITTLPDAFGSGGSLNVIAGTDITLQKQTRVRGLNIIMDGLRNVSIDWSRIQGLGMFDTVTGDRVYNGTLEVYYGRQGHGSGTFSKDGARVALFRTQTLNGVPFR